MPNAPFICQHIRQNEQTQQVPMVLLPEMILRNPVLKVRTKPVSMKIYGQCFESKNKCSQLQFIPTVVRGDDLSLNRRQPISGGKTALVTWALLYHIATMCQSEFY